MSFFFFGSLFIIEQSSFPSFWLQPYSLSFLRKPIRHCLQALEHSPFNFKKKKKKKPKTIAYILKCEKRKREFNLEVCSLHANMTRAIANS